MPAYAALLISPECALVIGYQRCDENEKGAASKECRKTVLNMSTDKTKQNDFDLSNVIAVIWRGKWTILLCTLLMLIGGVYQANVRAVPKFMASATLVLDTSGDNLVDIETVVTGISSDTSAINTELLVLKSRGLITQLVQDLELTADPEFNSALDTTESLSDRVKALLHSALATVLPNVAEDIAGDDSVSALTELYRTTERVQGVISVINQRNTFVFEIRVTTTDPDKSALIANSLAQLYIQDQIQVRFDATESAGKWLSERVAELQEEWETKQAGIKELRAQIELPDPEALFILGQKLRDARELLEQTVAEQQKDRLTLERYEQIQQSEDMAAMAQEIGLDAGESPDQARADNAQARDRLINNFNALRAQLERTVLGAEGRIAALRASVSKQELTFGEQSDLFVRLQQMEREALATRTLFETFLNRLKETTVLRGIQQADSRVLSEAIPGLYVSPRKSFILAVSIAFGVMLGIGTVLLASLRMRGFRSALDLQNFTQLPVLGQLPKMRLGHRRNLLPFLRDYPTSPGAEANRNARTSAMMAVGDTKSSKLFMITSSLAGEGKTTQSIALAQNIAKLGKRTLLVDLDLRRRSIREYFPQVKHSAGFNEALDQTNEPIRTHTYKTDFDGLEILFGSKLNGSPTDTLASIKFEQLLERMRKEYDYVILDTPPVLVVPDARVIAPYADICVIAVKWNSTGKLIVRDTVQELRSVNGTVAGTLLTQINQQQLGAYEYGGYSKYYGKY